MRLTRRAGRLGRTCVLACVLASGCGTNATESMPAMAPVQAPQAQPVAFEPVISGQHSGVREPETRVITSPEAFAALWSDIHRPHAVIPPPQPLANDHGTMIVAVFMGERIGLGHALTIDAIHDVGEALVVEVVEQVPERCLDTRLVPDGAGAGDSPSSFASSVSSFGPLWMEAQAQLFVQPFDVVEVARAVTTGAAMIDKPIRFRTRRKAVCRNG